MKASSLYSGARRYWRKQIRPLVIMAIVVFCLRSSLADWNDVPTGSMKPTILEGDRVYVNKLAYDLKVPFTTLHLAEWSDPKRGDVVVFYSPYDGIRLVKRVIGLPGDTVELRQDKLLLNGKPVAYDTAAAGRLRDVSPEDRSQQIFALEELPGCTHSVAAIPAIPARRDFGPCVVPNDHYFVMGDNRDNSFDSRFFGPVERKRIVGRATTVVLSLDHQHHWLPRWHRFFRSLDG